MQNCGKQSKAHFHSALAACRCRWFSLSPQKTKTTFSLQAKCQRTLAFDSLSDKSWLAKHSIRYKNKFEAIRITDGAKREAMPRGETTAAKRRIRNSTKTNKNYAVICLTSKWMCFGSCCCCDWLETMTTMLNIVSRLSVSENVSLLFGVARVWRIFSATTDERDFSRKKI